MVEFESFIIPCGKCIGCRLDYTREWSDRCYLESLCRSPNWFVTLTYDDLNLPVSEVRQEDGSFMYTNSLVKQHLSKFIKDLRSYYDYHYDFQGFSFYGCGEYGSKYSRPHYHVLIFGLPIDDLTVHTYKDGFITYNSDIFSKVWNKGFVTINEFSYETASYVSRYCMKKLKGSDTELYSSLNLEPEFSLMSRSPGIGYSYYESHKDEIFDLGYISVKSANGVSHHPIPNYFLRQLEKDDPTLFLRFKNDKKNKSLDRFVYDINHSSSNLSKIYQLEVDEASKLSQIKALRRNFENSYNCI